MNRLPIVQVFFVSFMLGGCATSAVERNATFVNTYAKANVGASAKWQQSPQDAAAQREFAARLLAAPLTQDNAIKLALALSPAFQAMLSDGAALSAAATQSARLANPIFTFERLTRRDGGVVDIEIGRRLSVSLLEFITLPSRLKVAESIQVQAQLRGAMNVVEMTDNVRQAWVRAVAAQQSLTYFEQVMDAAEASAELAKRLYKVGNFSKLQRARQQVFYADAAAQFARAKQTALATREALTRVLGLDATLADKLQLPPRLPDLPSQPKSETLVTQAAIEQRLDVQMAVAEINGLATKYGLSNLTSYVNVFHAAAIRNSETGKPAQRGVELALSIPLFDWGDAYRSQAQAQYLAATQRVLQTSINAASSVREQYAAWLTAYALSRHYRDEIVPLRKAIADEMLLKYNGMLSSVFDLLADTRAQISSVILAIDAERDFWLADAALQASLLGKPIGGKTTAAATVQMNDAAAGH